MNKDYSQKTRDYIAPVLECQRVSSDVVCLSNAYTTESYEIDNNFEW